MKRRYDEANKWQDLILDMLAGVPDTNNFPALDSFGRRRSSHPYTIFDSKLLGDNRALFWDEASGTGTSSSYDASGASVTLSVSENTEGTHIRQTFQRFNYQPGKSQLINMTFVGGESAAGIRRRVGYFDQNDGLFFEHDASALRFVVRSSADGTVTDTQYEQADWNLDTLSDLDTTKAQIFYLDFESLQVGSVRFGFVIDGKIRYGHVAHHANRIDGVYFSTPNNPIRYEIYNDGTGPAATLECICTTVISEGGQDTTGITRSISTAGTQLSASVADTLYALIGIRLKSTHLDNVVKISKVNVIAETNDDFEWNLLLNPTVAGTFNYSDETNSAVQSAKGATANTVTGGTLLAAGWGKSGSAMEAITDSLRYLGSSITGTPDSIVLCIRPLTNSAVIQGAITYIENA